MVVNFLPPPEDLYGSWDPTSGGIFTSVVQAEKERGRWRETRMSLSFCRSNTIITCFLLYDRHTPARHLWKITTQTDTPALSLPLCPPPSKSAPHPISRWQRHFSRSIHSNAWRNARTVVFQSPSPFRRIHTPLTAIYAREPSAGTDHRIGLRKKIEKKCLKTTAACLCRDCTSTSGRFCPTRR